MTRHSDQGVPLDAFLWMILLKSLERIFGWVWRWLVGWGRSATRLVLMRRDLSRRSLARPTLGSARRGVTSSCLASSSPLTLECEGAPHDEIQPRSTRDLSTRWPTTGLRYGIGPSPPTFPTYGGRRLLHDEASALLAHSEPAAEGGGAAPPGLLARAAAWITCRAL